MNIPFLDKIAIYRDKLKETNKSYAQEGEDLILQRFFADKPNGFYIDIGAHHPYRFSNTYLFYTKGWNGINVDATPGSMDLFKSIRPKDINLELAIGKKRKKMNFYMFNEPALNTFSKKLAQEYKKSPIFQLNKTVKIDTIPLSELLDTHLGTQTIDFLDIDVEGLDLEVLQTNNWQKYRPRIILIEDLKSFEFDRPFDSKIYTYLKKLKYEPFAKTVNTIIYRDTNQNK